MHAEHPELIRDQYWDDVLPDELPHTVASQPFRSSPYMGSTAHLEMTTHQAEIFYPDTPQLHKLDEESDENVTDEEMIPIDGGESGQVTLIDKNLREWNEIISFSHRIPPKRRLRRSVTRQTSGDSEAPGSSVTRKPSMMSVIGRVFQRDGTAMGSNLSLRSNRARPFFGRSVSRISTGGPAGAAGSIVSRPHSPILGRNNEDIFKMSDLNLNEDEQYPPTVVEKTVDMSKLPPLPSLNLKTTVRSKKFGKVTVFILRIKIFFQVKLTFLICRT